MNSTFSVHPWPHGLMYTTIQITPAGVFVGYYLFYLEKQAISTNITLELRS